MSASRGTQRSDPATDRLTGWIRPVVTEAGYDLEELVVTPAGRRSVVRVVVDRDAGVTLDDIAEVSRAVSDVLDRNDDGMGRTPYVLEVTSPGVDRPLTEPRHWRRNTGRLVVVTAGPAGSTEQLTGRITAVEEDGVTLAVEAKGKPGAKKRPPQPRRLPWAELGAGRVQVEFGRADEPGDSTDDTADDIAEHDAAEHDDLDQAGLADDDGGEK
ncbi:ribosome maturation factor RimP [Blastococcus sp. MG754426]|uniref:ribosome maturation factor RimP n=1 Tax=unclassified Blastococcus TaxID=2619396 RepID=UPI001EF0F755|nr:MULTISPECIES: ribosome maturation factor RimP [unclassified Blastococcus]MCF6505803.1 ribosome maturation factor RimP [Blastococcus sp. MG754426]MCF6511117.1 ribosome maturation factor RimP [Blastococcus sp. MG754427]MCF6734960.1 ribosome maturation factor RimP [Blastococcus sp. KM273129]